VIVGLLLLCFADGDHFVEIRANNAQQLDAEVYFALEEPAHHAKTFVRGQE